MAVILTFAAELTLQSLYMTLPFWVERDINKFANYCFFYQCKIVTGDDVKSLCLSFCGDNQWERYMKSCTRMGNTSMHRSIVNYGVFLFVQITRMANERYFRLICDKFNVLKICSSGNCERKCIISYDLFLYLL